MREADSLSVWYRDRTVGKIHRDSNNRMGFTYSEEWLSHEGFAISVSLPLTEEAFSPDEGVAHRFFANLLPEGNARKRVVQQRRIPDHDFDLLWAIGGECAGALSLLPVDREPPSDHDYTLLPPPELARLIRFRGNYVAGGATARDESEPEGIAVLPRLSLAGAQDKCPVRLIDGEVHLPRGEAPSSHIIKFAVPDYKHVPAYEAVLTALAEEVGLETCTLEFRRLRIGDDEFDYLVVERFDRVASNDGGVTRLHQEDFCQALGLGPERKYEGTEGNGGASLARVLTVIREHSSEPALDTLQLLRWQIFNSLAGNSDGHAKNLALLYGKDGGTRLAPFYDLVCTRAIAHVDHHLAFAVGDERDPGRIDDNDWRELADRLDVHPGLLRTLRSELVEKILDRLPAVLEEFQERHGPYPALQRVDRVVTTQCRRAEDAL